MTRGPTHWCTAVDGVILSLLGISAFHILSPVADMVLSASRYFYAAVLALNAVLILLRSSPQSPVSVAAGKDSILVSTTVCMAVLALFVAVHAVVRPDSASSDFRYLLLVALAGIVLWRLDLRALDRLIGAMAFFFCGYFVYVAMVYGFMELGWVDREEWAVTKLKFLPDENPIAVLERTGTQSYLIYYSVAMTRADDIASIGSIEFTRLTAFFVEPSDAALVLGPLLLFCLHQVLEHKRRWLVPAAALTAMFLWAYSVAGFVSMLLALLVAGLARPVTSTFPRVVRLASAGALFAVFGLMLFDPQFLLQLVGGNKLAQFSYFFEQISSAAELYLGSSAFGQGIGADFGHRTYGILAVGVQQGVLGALALMLLLAPFVICAWRLLRTGKVFVGVLGFYSLFMFLKTSEIVNLFFLLLYVFVIRHSAEERRTVKCALRNRLAPAMKCT